MGIEPGRVVQVRTPGDETSSSAGKYRFGSGYLVADGLVLTARHVLVPPEFSQKARPVSGQRCEIAFADGVWRPAGLAAAGEIDAAVLRTAPGGQWAPGPLGQTGRHGTRALGCPGIPGRQPRIGPS